jgi:hypothetical protein
MGAMKTTKEILMTERTTAEGVVLMREPKVVQFADGSLAPLSNTDRERLLKVARLREKVAKAAFAEHGAQLMANFDQQLATVYSFDTNETWKKAFKAADDAARVAQKAVDEECEQLGIPKQSHPQSAARVGMAAWKAQRASGASNCAGWRSLG